MTTFPISLFEKINSFSTDVPETRDYSPEAFAEAMRALSSVRPPRAFTKAALDEAKNVFAFMGGRATTRATLESRHLIVLDADSSDDVESILNAVKGYECVMWDTYKNGLRDPGTKDGIWEPDTTCSRARFVLFLDTPILASEWDASKLMSLFPGQDKRAAEFSRLNYVPATWNDAQGHEIEVIHASGKLFPSALLRGVSNTPVKTHSFVDSATLDRPREMMAGVLKTARNRNNALYIAQLVAIRDGNAVHETSGGSNQLVMELADRLSDDFRDYTVESLGDMCEPSLALMRAKTGSTETGRDITRHALSHRKYIAEQSARVADLPVPRPSEVIEDPRTDYERTPHEILDTEFGTLTKEDGCVEIYHIDDRQVCRIQGEKTRLIQRVLMRRKPAYGVTKDGDPREMTARMADTFIDNWVPLARNITPIPELIRFASDPGYCYRRLDFDPTEGAYPAWKEFLTRLSHPEVFMSFVWAMFEKGSADRQIMWIKGDGEDGKSVVIKCLRKVLAQASVIVIPETFKDAFGMAELENKRFAVIPDCSDSRVLMNSQLRMLTSGDGVRMNKKYKTGESQDLDVKFMVASNYEPDLTSQDADTSRLLLLYISTSKNKDDPQWAGKLYLQMPYFLYACREAYGKLTTKGGKIDRDEKMLKSIERRAASFEEEFALMAERLFDVTKNPDDRVPAGAVFYECTANMARHPTSPGWKQSKYIAFRAYVQRKGIQFKELENGNYFTGVKPLFELPEARKTRLRSITGGK